MENLIKKYEERRAALVAQSDKSTDVTELRSLQKQIQDINGDIEELRAAIPKDTQKTDERTDAVNGDNGDAEKRSAEPPKFVQGKGFIPSEERQFVDYNKMVETREKAGNDLKEKRAVNSPLSVFGEIRTVTIGDGTSIVVPKTFSSTINPDFNVVSSLVDSVAHLSLNGGESFTQPYVKEIEAASYTAEGADAATAETKFDYVDMNKSKITAYAELSEEIFKLPDANYADVVFQNIRTSMRMTLTKEILIGTGATNHMVGIFSNAAKAIDSDTDLALSTIDDQTLDRIIFNYGGAEDVEGTAALILSKSDLLAFATVRTSTTLRYYDIRPNGSGNTGTINGVPYIINSACNALTKTTTAAGSYCMCYGNLSNYLLVEFSPMEVKQSNDYKFKQGNTAYRGVAFCAGNVVRQNGFLRIKKSVA